jgi:hypothetical protein
MSKEKSEKSAAFAKGGSTKMFPQGYAGTQKPGVTTPEGRSSNEKVKGGSGKMFGHMAAGPQQPGVSGHSPSGDGGKFASGGKTKMFGPQQAGPQTPGGHIK